MLDWTDRHCRHFHRQLSQHALLYTEMVTTGAILNGQRDFLSYDEFEHPVALQLGGSDPQALAQCAKLAQTRGYDEINLNVGCPSDRVQNGRFGACLMAKSEIVAQCIQAMAEEVDIPVTVKTRIGIDAQDSYEFLLNFVQYVSEKGGCEHFIIHARKAWLNGLSPKENREIPPLDYPRVHQLKKDLPHLNIIINGGIKTLDQAMEHIAVLDGVMVGREVYQNPYLLAEVDHRLFNSDTPIKKRTEIVRELFPYIERELIKGTPLNRMTRSMLGLFQNMTGARQWRRYISENAHKKGAGLNVLIAALAKIPQSLDL